MPEREDNIDRIVKEAIENKLKQPLGEEQKKLSLYHDLGLDSLDFAEITVYVDGRLEELGILIDEAVLDEVLQDDRPTHETLVAAYSLAAEERAL